MEKRKGNCIFAQSGGPTAVINAGIAGGVLTALSREEIGKVYCAEHGVRGVLDERFFDMGEEDEAELLALRNTPASAMGSVRYKLKPYEEDETDYKRILEVFRKYDVRYFFYNGGNDSMDTCMKISSYMKKTGYPVSVIGIPKTIDNDLVGTDHCPGFGSAAKYIATSVAEISLDARIYQSPLVVIVEIMGRNAGWLTASASLASVNGNGPDLVYLPEVPFTAEKFLSDVARVMQRKEGKCVVAVSEGIRYPDGRYVGEDKSGTDVFGHSALGGVCGKLKATVVEKLGVKCKAIELNILQRCAAHCASETDVEETFEAGRQAVERAIGGETDVMIGYARKTSTPYEISFISTPLPEAANAEKKIPSEWIGADGTSLRKEFFDYALPLIQGDPDVRKSNGLPLYARLKKVLAKPVV